MSDNFTVSALPDISTLQLSPGQRSIGRLAQITLPAEPEGKGFTDLAGDIFHEMFQSEPKTRETVPAERAVNHSLIEWMRQSYGHETGRNSTVANLPASMMTAGFMYSHLTSDEVMKEALRKQEEAAKEQEKANDLGAQASALETAAQALADSNHQQSQQMANKANKLRTQAGQAAAKAASAAQAATDQVTAAQGKPLKQAALAAAMSDAAKEAKAVAEAGVGWGFGPGSPIQNDPKAALEFIKRNKGKVSRIARLAGRLRGVAIQARRERTPQGVIPVGAGLTQDFLRLFPTELALLRDDVPDALRAEQVGRWADGGLLGYRPGGDKERRGPFVAAVDVSPSMHGTREVVAKAVALGISQIAKSEGREYILFCFASDTQHIYQVRSSEGWQNHLKWAEYSVGGGTDFDMALAYTMNALRDLKAVGADALFISDGEAGVATETVQAWQDFGKETGSRLMYVPVGHGGFMDIENLADKVISLGELDESAGVELSAELGRWM